MRSSGFLFLLFSAVLISCKGILGRELPEKRPHKITVELYDGGGMMPEGTSYYICNDSCYVKFWHDRVTNIFHYKLDSAQLDELYKVFYTNYFEKIKAKEMETYDRGGISIYLRFGDMSYNVSDAGSTYILESWIKNFQAVESAIYASADAVIKENTVPLVVQFDKEVLKEENAVYFSTENRSYNTDSSRAITKTFNLLKGQHEYYISLSDSKVRSYERKAKTYVSDIVSVCGEHDTLFVALKDSTFTLHKNVECGPEKK